VVAASTYVRRLCRKLLFRAYRPYVMRRIGNPSEARLLGRTLLTDPDVFHPVFFLSTRLLVEEIQGLDVAAKRFLDMGTGSGAVGVFAGLQGAVVTACDVNPHAVELARTNLRRHGIEAEVLESNLFSALAGRVFDVISFNLPFYSGEPRTPLEAAFLGGEDLGTVEAFIANSPRFLAEGGTVVVLFSEDVDRQRIVAGFARQGFAVAHERIAHRWCERFHTVRFQKAILPEDRPWK
jgi:release factor glutamine methyltransferase